jgi:DNA-binding SARP family transcriptional activator/Tfp pilus assembly protein PilF
MSAGSTGVTLQLFGAPRILGIAANDESELLGRPKTLALLAYLAIALPRGLRRRDALLALFWPDSDTDHARNSLRQGLHWLRRTLPDGSIVSRGNHEVGIADDVIGVDVWSYERDLDHGRENSALEMYRGDLMTDFTLPDNVEFDDWLGLERERLRRRATRGALVLARSNDLDGNSVRAGDWARYALARSPYDESLLREVMGLLSRAGDRAGAASVFSAAVTRLQKDLGVTLSAETTQFANRLLHSAQDTSKVAHEIHGMRAAGNDSLQPALTPPAFVQPRAVSADARFLCLQARQFALQRSPVTIGKAIELYERAIRLSPDYAEAHMGIASAFCQAPVYTGMPGTDAWPRVRSHASRALRIDSRLGEAHTFFAHATLCSEYDWHAAEQGYRRALELDPISWVSRQLYALYFLTCVGREKEAMSILERARDQMPDIPGITAFCGMSCMMSRQFERALMEVEQVLAIDPGFVQAYWIRGSSQEGLGDLDGAIASFEQGAALTRDSSLFIAQLARACAKRGDRDRALRLLAHVEARGEEGGPGVYFRVEALAALGDTERAMDALQGAYRQRNPFMVFAGVHFGLDTLRDLRPFRDLLIRLGLPSRALAHSTR